jgi:DNA-binding NarL/FixJ family response regulator
MTIRILIADDHPIVAEGVCRRLLDEPDMEVVACVPDGRKAINRTTQLAPDVVVMDISMPHLNGIDATAVIAQRVPSTRVVALSEYSDALHIARAIRAGAKAYVTKASRTDELVKAVRTVTRGGTYLSSGLARKRRLIEHLLADRAADPLQKLSMRERQVLQLVVEGVKTATIADTLHLSPKTVETYRSRIAHKVGVRDMLGLLKFAIVHGLTSVER